MDKYELISRYKAGERNFRGVDLREMKIYGDVRNTYQLADIDLSGANLTGATLNYVELINVNLQDSNLTNADFGNSNFTNANLQGADLTDVEIRHCKFIKANFKNSNLTNLYVIGGDFSDFSEADLTSANCTNATLICNLSRAIFKSVDLTSINFRISNSMANWGSTTLNYIDFSGLNLSGISFVTLELLEANFNGTNLSNTDFDNADLRYAILTNADLSHANLYNARLNGANLENANLYGANLRNADLEGAKLKNANLNQANLTDADLKNAILENAHFCQTVLSGVNFKNVNLDNINLTDAILNGVCWQGTKIDKTLGLSNQVYLICKLINLGGVNQDLQGIDFSGEYLADVNLQGANLSGAILIGTYLRGANLSGANLSDSNLSDSNLSQSNFSNANLSRVNLTKSFLVNANLSSANLTSANLTNVGLSCANLSNSNLTNVNFTNSDLGTTDFSGVDLSSVNFAESAIYYANLEKAINIPANILCLYAPLPENNPNTKLVNALREKTKGVTMPSEGDYPYEIFLWDVQGKGEFSLEGLLRKRSELVKVELDYFWQTLPSDNLSLKQKFINAYQTLLESLQPHLTGLEVYELKTSRFVEKYSKATVYMILAETITGDYLGISICLDFTETQDLNALPCFEIRDFALKKSENIELVIAIESALQKANSLLPNMDEVSEFIWQIGEKRDSVFQNLAVATKHFTIQEYIYKNNEDEDDDERDSFSFCFSKSTHELINTNLTNLRYYFVGAVRIDIYLVGQANNGDFIGIHTKVVWT